MNRAVAGGALLALASGFLLRAQESIVPPEQRVSEAEARVELGSVLATPQAPPQGGLADTIVPPDLRVSEIDARLELGRLLATPRKPESPGAGAQAAPAVAATPSPRVAGGTIVPRESLVSEEEARVELGRLLAERQGATAGPSRGVAETLVPPELRVSETDARVELGRLLASPGRTAATTAPPAPKITGDTLVPPESRVGEEQARTELGRLLAERRGPGGTASPDLAESIVPPESRVSAEDARLALADLLSEPPGGAQPGTIVPKEGRVSDYEARLTLARLLVQSPKGLEEALRQYDRLVAKHGGYPERRERASLLLRLKRFDTAARELAALRKERPRDVDLMADLADAEVGRGRFVQARDLYRSAIRMRAGSADLSLRYARQLPAWGDFYEAERRFREALSRSPRRDVELELAGVLVASQQYEAAEEIYRSVLRRDRRSIPSRLGIAEIRLREKDYAAVIPEAHAALAVDPRNAAALAMLGQASRELGQYDEARGAYERLAAVPGRQAEAYLGRGLVEKAAGEDALAQQWFDRARQADAGSVAALYRTLGTGEDGAIRVGGATASPEALTQLAQLSGSEGRFQVAEQFYGHALARDPSYFPARMGLAEVLAAQQQYDRALEQLRALRADFPDNSKVILTQARVLSWARRYEESLATYRELRALNPEDVVPVREMARVAAWSKQMNLAQDLYRELYDRPLNARLRDQVAGMPGGPELLAAMQQRRSERPYSAYDQLLAAAADPGLSVQARRTAATLLDQWLPSYRLQRSTWLEARGKLNAWHLDFLRAEDVLQELVAFQPGHQEALFDLAQAQAAQDLRGRAVTTYQQLLRVDPLHNLASRALERERIRASPAVQARYSFWDEKGSGRNADIQRHTWSLGGELVYGHQHWFRFSAGAWLDEPGGEFPSSFALGGIMEVQNVWNEYLRTSASWIHKDYLTGEGADSNTGHFAATVNLFDWVHLSLGYVRSHENPNGFALRQGIHTDAVELGIFATPHRYVELRGAVSKLWYTDGNEGVWAWFAPGFILNDHPHTLKLVFRGDYRDTAEESTYFFNGLELEDIRHPYWTPRNYLRGQAILEWRHDLSRDFYAGAEQHYYALRAGVGTDNTRNDSYRLEAEWHYEFSDVWTIEALGVMERSREWDGNSVLVSLRRRFP